jgi:hypothetical protein
MFTQLHGGVDSPDIASLVDLLFAARKEVRRNKYFFLALFVRSKERAGPAQRRPGESTLRAMFTQLHWR